MKKKTVNLFNPSHFDKSVNIEIGVDLKLNDYIQLPLSLIDNLAIPKTSQTSIQISDTELKSVDAKQFYGEKFHGFIGIEWDNKRYALPAVVAGENNIPVLGRKGIETLMNMPAKEKVPFLSLLVSAFGGWGFYNGIKLFKSAAETPPGNPPPLTPTPRGMGVIFSIVLMLAGTAMFIYGIKITIDSFRDNRKAKRLWETINRDWGE
jgi:hypothetical protein